MEVTALVELVLLELVIYGHLNCFPESAISF